MEPTPKKRRPWLIVAFVLAVVSLCSWWYWPRGDARFVGKWEIVQQVRPFDIIEFSSSGTVIQTPAGKEPYISVWHVERDKLIFGRATPAIPSRFINWAASLVLKTAKIRVVTMEIPYDIREITTGFILMEYAPGTPKASQMALRRLSP